MTSKKSPQSKGPCPLILDASAAINFLGTGIPAEFLKAFDRPVIIEDYAYREVGRDPFHGSSGSSSLDKLVSLKALHVETLSEEGFQRFLLLTGAAPPDDLGDGEAGTIAHSIVTDGIPVIDETKGLRIARKEGRKPQTSVELFRSIQKLKRIETLRLADAVFNALIKARMRVLPEHRGWVFDLIGEERASMCPSLGKCDKHSR